MGRARAAGLEGLGKGGTWEGFARGNTWEAHVRKGLGLEYDEVFTKSISGSYVSLLPIKAWNWNLFSTAGMLGHR